MKISSAILSSLTLLSLNIAGLHQANAQSQDSFEFQRVPVIVSGSGCPGRTAEGVLNGDTLSVVFNEFQALAPSPRVVSKSCSVRIGLNVPSGLTVQPLNVKYIGSADVPPGGSAELAVRITFEGRNVPTVNNPNMNFTPGFSDQWSKDVGVTLGAINACNRPVSSIFGINTNIIARARGAASGQETQISVDTIDSTFGPVLYRIQFAFLRC